MQYFTTLVSALNPDVHFQNNCYLQWCTNRYTCRCTRGYLYLKHRYTGEILEMLNAKRANPPGYSAASDQNRLVSDRISECQLNISCNAGSRHATRYQLYVHLVIAGHQVASWRKGRSEEWIENNSGGGFFARPFYIAEMCHASCADDTRLDLLRSTNTNNPNPWFSISTLRTPIRVTSYVPLDCLKTTETLSSTSVLTRTYFRYN